MGIAAYNRGSRAISNQITQASNERRRTNDVPALPVGWSLNVSANTISVHDEAGTLIHREAVPFRSSPDLNRAAIRANDPCLRKMTNDWHVDDTCSIKITDGEGWSDDYCRDSLAHGNPHPQPVNGKAFTVWASSRWQTDELRERIEPAVLDILCEAIARIAESKEDMRAAKQLAADEHQREQQAGLSAALTKVQP